LAALHVERVIDGVARWIHPVAPEARPDDGERDRVIAHERLEAAQRAHRAQQVEPADAEREAVGPLARVALRAVAALAEPGEQDRALDAVLVHVVEQLRELGAAEEGISASEVVLLDPDHPVGLLHVAHVHVHETVDRSRHEPASLATRAGALRKHLDVYRRITRSAARPARRPCPARAGRPGPVPPRSDRAETTRRAARGSAPGPR